MAALERASELQRALENCTEHAEVLACGATALLDDAAPALAAAGGAADGEAGAAARLPQLYDSAALQLWLLKCCQSVGGRGGEAAPTHCCTACASVVVPVQKHCL